ncbi:MAG: phage major capsid protein [Actinomycetota bacterium]
MVTTATSKWVGITSAGVTASWDAENAEVSDDSPTIAQAEVPVYKGAAFVAASFELFEDAAGLAEQVARLFVDARDRLEATAFETGSGSGQPTGVWTEIHGITASRVVSTTAAVIGEVDLHAVYQALPVRYRPSATWVTNPKWALEIKRLGTNISSTYSGDFTEAPARDILGRPLVVSDDSPAVVTTTALDSRVMFGDFSNYVIADRVGSSIEFLPHLFGSNGRPTANRGWYLHWRSGGDVVNVDAFRELVDKTSA